MSSTKEYLDFILEQLSDLDEISFRAMMGEYIIYYPTIAARWSAAFTMTASL